MYKFSGYRIKGKNIGPIESTLSRARTRIHEAATEEYHRMLSDEVAELVDDIVMNIRPRPNCPIIDEARSLLNQRIMDAENFNSGTEYDLRAGVQLIPNGDGYTYCTLSASNPLLEQAFAGTPGIEDYTTPLETDVLHGVENTPQSSKWEELNSRYAGQSPMMSATLTTQVDFDPSRLRLLNRDARAATRARHHLTTLLMGRYACGKNIPNEQLMRILDCALLRLTGETESMELERTTRELTNLLPQYTIEEIMRDPRQPMETSVENNPVAEHEPSTGSMD